MSSACQLKVYVVWSGTDSEGNYFTSFAKRFSMYAGEVSSSLMSGSTANQERAQQGIISVVMSPRNVRGRGSLSKQK